MKSQLAKQQEPPPVDPKILERERELALALQKEQEEFGNYPFRPADVPEIWNSKTPKEVVITKYLAKLDNQGSNYQYGQAEDNEMRYERDDIRWIADYTLHNMIFLMNDLNLKESYTIAKILNAMQLVTQRNSDFLRDTMRQLVELKKITLPQVKLILDNVQKVYYSHSILYDQCAQKQEKRNKVITLYQPEPQIATNLVTNCKEIIQEVPIDYEALKRQAESQSQLSKMGQDGEQPEIEDEVDPENPLYGLEQRLRNMNLDEESLRIIKEKLTHANTKIKQALEDRQKNLDSKLNEKPGAKKK